jgi:hypothetical protein
MFGLVSKRRSDREHAAHLELLVNQRDDARALAAERLSTITRQAADITKLREDAERPAPPPVPRLQPMSGEEARLRGALHRSEKARAALDADRLELIQVNDHLNKQLREHAEAAAGDAS